MVGTAGNAWPRRRRWVRDGLLRAAGVRVCRWGARMPASVGSGAATRAAGDAALRAAAAAGDCAGIAKIAAAASGEGAAEGGSERGWELVSSIDAPDEYGEPPPPPFQLLCSRRSLKRNVHGATPQLFFLFDVRAPPPRLLMYVCAVYTQKQTTTSRPVAPVSGRHRGARRCGGRTAAPRRRRRTARPRGLPPA